MIPLSETAREAISTAIERGVDVSADKLAKMSRTKWNLQTVSVHTGDAGQLAKILLDDVETHYGVFFSMPGAFLSVILSDSSGRRVVTAYLGRNAARLKSIADLEMEVIAEVANVLANAVAGALADACRLGFILSPQGVVKGSKKALRDELSKRFPGVDRGLTVTSHLNLASDALSTDCSMLILMDEPFTRKVVAALEGA